MRLLVLILVPLVGASAAAAAEIASLADSATNAAHAQRSINAAASLDAASAAYEQEITPAFSAAVVRNPALLNDAPTAAVRQVAGHTPPLAALRARTDAAFRHIGVSPSERVRFVAELATARSGVDTATQLAGALSGGTALLAGLGAAEQVQIRAAQRAGLDQAGARALTTVQLVARASQTAAAEVGAYTPTQFATASALPRLRATATQAWSAAVSAAQDLVEEGTRGVVAAWTRAARVPAVRGFNTFLAAQINAGTPRAHFLVITRLVVPDSTRNSTYAGVLQVALRAALDAGHAQRMHALHLLEIIAGVVLVLIGSSIAISTAIARTITRPLGRLAAQATRISEGHLIDVQVSGPTEVRTVAKGLSASVASLRDIGAYAATVVAGDVDPNVAQPEFPGPLGEVVHSSLARIVNAVDERKVAELALAHRAAHDPLTELPNRGQAMVHIRAALGLTRSTSSIALMFIGLDGFKSVNDTMDYAAGNQVLQGVAARLLDLVRQDGTVARFGGDEFVVLMQDVDDEDAVVTLAERVVAGLSTPMTIDDRQVQIGASVGLSFRRPGSVDASRLVQETDAAMRRAKARGRGRVDTVDDHLRLELLERHELEAAIAAGLQRNEFELYYQPVVNLKNGATNEVEALIRWNRPGHGLLRPDAFIPVAERSALIKDIGRWVLGQAARQLAIWREYDPAHAALSVAVNISGSHLTSPQLIADVTDGLTAAGVDASHLILEVTETVLVDDDQLAIGHLQTLRAMGVRVSLDDFGTGYTSIGRIPILPVDILKIDRSFVASADAGQNSLVQLMVGAAHAFGLAVIAEGIEDEEQAERMRQAGVELGQGYLFARPGPVVRLSNLRQAVRSPQRARSSA